MYEQNDNMKVTFVAHSYGGPVSLYFLTRIVTQEWKDTYVASYFPLAGASGGTSSLGLSSLLTEPTTNSSFEMQVGVPLYFQVVET